MIISRTRNAVIAWLTLAVLVQSIACSQQSPQMLLIPAGTFTMGGKSYGKAFYKLHGEYRGHDENPQHPVRLTRPFYLSKTEVTVEQFQYFVQQTHYQTTAEKSGGGIVGFDPHESKNGNTKYSFRQKPEFTWRNPGFKQTDRHPVVGVSWQDARAYCRWLSEKEGVRYRLPTEAEWEYACRAGTDTFFSWGDDYSGVIHKQANIGNVELEKAWPTRVIEQWLVDVDSDPGDPHVYTAPVASYPANPFGLCDMHGNVWEWCEDLYLDTAYQQFKRPKYDTPIPLAVDPLNTKPVNDFGDWRIMRGGSWFVSPIQARSAVRSFFDATDAACYVGFRVARDASAEDITKAQEKFQREREAWRVVEKAVGQFRSRTTELRAEFSNSPEKSVTSHLPHVVGLTNVSISARGNLKDPSVLEDVARVPRLRDFRLHHAGPHVTDRHFAAFAKRSDLTSISLTATESLTDDGLAHFSKNKNLTDLTIECPKVTDDGLRLFAAFTKLQSLRIAGTSSKGDVLHDMKQAPLTSISVRNMSDAAAAALSQFPNLQALDCRSGELTSAGIAHIARLTKLTRLDLGSCKNIDTFAALSELRSLTNLSLARTRAGDEAVRFTSNMQNLGSLEIGSENLTDAGMRGICDILTLSSLNIDSPNVTDRGFVDFWRLNRLSFLVISAPQVTGSGFAALTELPRLRELRIYGTALTDRGMLHISEFPALRVLRIYALDGKGPAALTDKGLLYLLEAKQLTTLELHRSDSKITDQGIAKLKQEMPRLQVQER